MPVSFEDGPLLRAKRQGRRSGYDPAEQTADCPYVFDRLQLRQQWLAGFSEGRKSYRREVDR